MHQFNEHHKELEGFSAYFDTEIVPLLKSKEADRKRENIFANRFRALCIFCGLVACVIAALIGQFGDAILGIVLITGGAAVLLPPFFLRGVSKFAKQQIVGGICNYVGWTFEERPTQFPDFKIWAELGLIRSGYIAPGIADLESSKQLDLMLGSRSISDLKGNFQNLKSAVKASRTGDESDFSLRAEVKDIVSNIDGGNKAGVEDRIAGEAHGVAFESVEVKLERRSGKTVVTDFHGQFITMTFPRKFLGKTVVLRDGGKRQKAKLNDMKRVGLVDPVFEDIFEAYGTDQVEARYLLDPVFMQKLIDLEKSVMGHDIQFGFANSQLLISISTGDRYEAGSMKHELMDTNRTQRLLNEIGAIFDVVDGVMPAQRR